MSCCCFTGGFCITRWRGGARWRAENQSISITTFHGELLKMRATPRHRATYVREILHIYKTFQHPIAYLNNNRITKEIYIFIYSNLSLEQIKPNIKSISVRIEWYHGIVNRWCNSHVRITQSSFPNIILCGTFCEPSCGTFYSP